MTELKISSRRDSRRRLAGGVELGADLHEIGLEGGIGQEGAGQSPAEHAAGINVTGKMPAGDHAVPADLL